MFMSLSHLAPERVSSPPWNPAPSRSGPPLGSVFLQHAQRFLRAASGSVKTFSCLAVLALCEGLGWADDPPAPFTNIAAIKVIPPDAASQKLPVRLRGIITAFNPRVPDAFLQDNTGGIYLSSTDLLESIKIGDVVDIEGVTHPGGFAPMVITEHIRVVGQTNLPATTPASRAALADGRFDSERVTVQALVLGISEADPDPRLSLMLADGPANAILVGRFAAELPPRLREATVRLSGISAPGHNSQRQATVARMLVTTQDPIEILQPGPENPEELPTSKIDSLFRYKGRKGQSRVVRVRGTVTAAPSSEKFFLQDEFGSVLISVGQQESLRVRAERLGTTGIKPGDLIEVIGEPFVERLSILLRADELKKVGVATLPRAMAIKPEAMSDGRYNGQRITCSGRVLSLGRSALSGRLEFTLRVADTVLLADVPNVGPKQVPSPVGSLVQVEGVLDSSSGSEWNSQVLMIHLNSPADVTVLELPPRSPMRLVVTIGSAIISAGLLALAWALVLRRQVRIRTADLAKTNATLQGIQEWQSLAIEATDLGLWDWDLSTGRIACSGAFAAIYGYKADEFPGTHAGFTSRVHAEDLPGYQAAIDRSVARHQPFHHEHRVVWPDGSLHWLSSHGKCVLNDRGEACRMIGAVRDVTERKQMEEQLRQTQKLEAIGQLAGGVAHDFNNILAAMMIQLGILQLDPSLDLRVRASLKDLEEEADRAASLTRQLLVFSRRAVLDAKPLDLEEVVDNLLKMLRRLIGENITLQFGIRGNLPMVEADAGMMDQLVMNLAVNARDAMPNGGRIRIAINEITFPLGETSVAPPRRPGHFVCLEVSDTGIGIDARTMKHIFEPFFTTKDAGKGTGLGLATVHGLVHQHNGWIEVESEVQVGTTFRVYLPALERANKRTPAPIEPAALPRGKESILVVEDQIRVRQLVATSLRHLGYTVHEASNAQEAIDAWHKSEGRFDLLLTDMIMPGGMTGMDLTHHLRGLKPGLKVIVSSGYSAELAQGDAMETSRVVYLPKPYEVAVLAETVRKLLDQAGAA